MQCKEAPLLPSLSWLYHLSGCGGQYGIYSEGGVCRVLNVPTCVDRPPRDDVDDDRYTGDHAAPRFEERFGPSHRGYGRDYEERPSRFNAADEEYDFRAGGLRAEWAGSGNWRDRDSGYYRGSYGEARAYSGEGSRGYGVEERAGSYDVFSDRDLLPPPPPPRGAAAVESDEEVDLDRMEFEAELARVAAEMEKVRDWQRFLCYYPALALLCKGLGADVLVVYACMKRHMSHP